MASFINEVKAGKISGVYLFYGEEAYKKRYFRDTLKKAVLNGDTMNYAAFEGKNIDWQAVYDSVMTMPFFADRRLIIIENSGKFSTKQEKGTEKQAEKGADIIERIINEAPESSCIAFFEESAAKNRRIYKLIASKGVVCECNEDSEDDVINWLAKGFVRQGRKVRKSTLALITGRCGLDYDRLRMEFEKIISYAGDREVIEDSDVLAVSSENIESRIFDMLGAMSEKNVPLVLKKYHDLLANKEHPLYIMAMLRSQIRTMLQICELRDKGMNANDIGRAAGKPLFVVRRSLGYLQHFTRQQMISMLDEINETDAKSKKGLITDQTGVELLLIKFSG